MLQDSRLQVSAGGGGEGMGSTKTCAARTLDAGGVELRSKTWRSRYGQNPSNPPAFYYRLGLSGWLQECAHHAQEAWGQQRRARAAHGSSSPVLQGRFRGRAIVLSIRGSDKRAYKQIDEIRNTGISEHTWGFPIQIKSTKVLMATPQGRRLGTTHPSKSRTQNLWILDPAY